MESWKNLLSKPKKKLQQTSRNSRKNSGRNRWKHSLTNHVRIRRRNCGKNRKKSVRNSRSIQDRVSKEILWGIPEQIMNRFSSTSLYKCLKGIIERVLEISSIQSLLRNTEFCQPARLTAIPWSSTVPREWTFQVRLIYPLVWKWAAWLRLVSSGSSWNNGRWISFTHHR